METLLTMTIAVGGIATGIGAIWTALLARRQAQFTERSLTQTERSLAEQNERSRLNLEVDLLTRMEDRFESPHLLSRRRAAGRVPLRQRLRGRRHGGSRALEQGRVGRVQLLRTVRVLTEARSLASRISVEQLRRDVSSILAFVQARPREASRRAGRSDAVRRFRATKSPGGRYSPRAWHRSSPTRLAAPNHGSRSRHRRRASHRDGPTSSGEAQKLAELLRTPL